jgi:hypothetical protein
LHQENGEWERAGEDGSLVRRESRADPGTERNVRVREGREHGAADRGDAGIAAFVLGKYEVERAVESFANRGRRLEQALFAWGDDREEARATASRNAQAPRPRV